MVFAHRTNRVLPSTDGGRAVKGSSGFYYQPNQENCYNRTTLRGAPHAPQLVHHLRCFAYCVLEQSLNLGAPRKYSKSAHISVSSALFDSLQRSFCFISRIVSVCWITFWSHFRNRFTGLRHCMDLPQWMHEEKRQNL